MMGKKRREEGKTYYHKRMIMLKGNRPRIVVRKTNKYLQVQYVKSAESKDIILLGVKSYELLKHGWPKELKGSLKSIPAAYLTGYLAGKKILGKEKNAEPIVDFGLNRNIHGSRIHACVKGLVDSGLKLNADEKAFPSEEKIKGENANKLIKQTFDKVKANIK